MMVNYITFKQYRDNEVYTFDDITEGLGGVCIWDSYGDYAYYKDKHFKRYKEGEAVPGKHNFTEISDESGNVLYILETVRLGEQTVVYINFSKGESEGKRESWICVEQQ